MRARIVVLDTSVAVEYLDLESPYRELVEKLFSDLESGRTEAIVTTVTIAEMLYTASRIYREAGLKNPNSEARVFIDWLVNHPGVRIVEPDLQLSIEAGEVKKKLKISLADAYVLAAANRYNAKALFLRVEREMKHVLDELTRDYNVEFLVPPEHELP